MKFLFLIFFAIYGAESIFQTKQSAMRVLQRQRRAGQEVLKRSNFERECVEELCDTEEYLEAQENHIPTIRMDHSQSEDLKLAFTKYTECRNKILEVGLDDPSYIDLRQVCFDICNNAAIVFQSEKEKIETVVKEEKQLENEIVQEKEKSTSDMSADKNRK